VITGIASLIRLLLAAQVEGYGVSNNRSNLRYLRSFTEILSFFLAQRYSALRCNAELGALCADFFINEKKSLAHHSW
jgi:hypothetical protein